MQQFYQKLADILEVDVVNPGDALNAFVAWDSLAVISIVADADATYHVILTAEDLKTVQTAGELWGMIEGRRK